MDNIYLVPLIVIALTIPLCIIAYYVGFYSGYAKCLKKYDEKQGNVDKKLIQYREYLVSETERWHKAGSDKTNSAIGKQDCTGHANALISARCEFEEVFNWDDLIEKQGV